MTKVYVSITGLRLKSPLFYPVFTWHAVRSYAEAQRADGSLSVRTKTIDGVHHTISAWRDKAAMRRYLTRPRHLAAIKVFSWIATGETVGFEAETVPDWPEARAIWERDGRQVGRG